MNRKMTSLLAVFCIAAILAACNLSANPTATLPPFPTPNKPMTALFSTPLPTIAFTKPAGSQPTPLPAGGNPTAAALPSLPPPASATAVPPTAPPPATQPPVQTATTAPSATSQATSTTAPTSGTVDLTRRTVVSVQAKQVSAKPAIDGDWSDLPDKEFPCDIIVYGLANWKNSADLSASFRLGWDADNLYLAVKVRDDVYAQNATGDAIFKGDSLEILVDTNVAADYYVKDTGPDDFQLGMTGGRPGVDGPKEAYLWQPFNIAGSRTNLNIAALRSDSEGITRYEVAIPWNVLEVTPKAGLHLGFVLSVSDNDNTSQNLQQKMASNVKTRVFMDPTTWGDLTLTQ